jgi:hypothetical protein
MTNTQEWLRARSDVRRKVTRSKGKTSTRVTGRGELSTMIGAREAHEDAGRVPMAIIDHALDNVRETRHGADGDALARLADRWAQAMGADLPALIGNERNSWSEAGTMPTDPATLASIAATTCGITGGIHPRVDAALAVHVTRKRHAPSFPIARAPKYVRRADDPARRIVTTGRRTIRPDVWHDPVTEQDRPRLKWTIVELPACYLTLESMTIGHGSPIERPPSAVQQREDNARVTRDSVKVNADPAAAVARAHEHAMKHDDPSGRWEWRANDDIRGVLTISRAGRIGISGSGYRVTGQRSIRAAIAAVQAQTIAQQ